MSKQILTTIVVAVLVGAAGFFGGYKYAQSKPANGIFTAQNGNRMAGFGSGTRRPGNGNNFINGTILSKDSDSLTIQLRPMPGAASSTNAGSSIVILSPTTQIFKAEQGTPDDLTVGENVTITGTNNSAGALTAQTIQVRQTQPDMTKPAGQ